MDPETGKILDRLADDLGVGTPNDLTFGPDGSLYWLARMLTAGEDPLYVARRLVRFATEDVGLQPISTSITINANEKPLGDSVVIANSRFALNSANREASQSIADINMVALNKTWCTVELNATGLEVRLPNKTVMSWELFDGTKTASLQT